MDAVSGATITSRAVIKGANQAMEKIAAVAGFTMESTSTAEHLGENRYAATAQGYGGPVKVYLTVDAEKTIQEISIGNNLFNETSGLGARALEESFQSQFIGKKLPVAAGDIDALSGATITTGAVLEAIGEISDGLDAGLADSPITEEKVEATPEPTKAPERTGTRKRTARAGSAATEAPAETPKSSVRRRKAGSAAATEAPATEAPATETPTEEPAATEAPAD